MFHSRNGLFFHAEGQGRVRIVKTNDGKDPLTRSLGDGQLETNIVCDVTLPENEWASVMATVSKDGESHDKWMAARIFHGLTLQNLGKATTGLVAAVTEAQQQAHQNPLQLD